MTGVSGQGLRRTCVGSKPFASKCIQILDFAGEIRYTDIYRPVWRNGRRPALKMRWRNPCRFESDHRYYFPLKSFGFRGFSLLSRF